MGKKAAHEMAKGLDIAAALGSITKEKSIGIDLVLDSLKDALASAAKRFLGKQINVEVKVDREKGTLEVYTRRFVVAVVEDPEKQIHIDEAKTYDPELEIGDELIEDLDIDVFGRTAIQTAKQVIVQRVREAERMKIFQDYGERMGELITGTVQQIDKGNILVNLGRTEALLPYKEQIRKERYRQGDTIRACIVDVRNNAKGPQVIISRTSPEFLARLFELEVPEIFDKTVKIVKVVRDPGHRSKIAVATTDERVDPVGACVGMRGNRVQAIVRELSNERIDIINWTPEISLLVRRVFSPAEVKRVHTVGEKKIVVIIRESDLAQAIGRDGQNIRLASRLTEKEIDVYGDEEFAALSEEERAAALAEAPEPIEGDLTQTVGETETQALDEAGIAEVEADETEPVEVGPASIEGEESPTGDEPVSEIVEQAIEQDSDGEKDLTDVIETTEGGSGEHDGAVADAGPAEEKE